MAAERIPVTRSVLEIVDLAELRPPARPPRRDFELERIRDPSVNRWFYEHVGADWAWTDRLGWSDSQWESWEARVETWAVLVDGEGAGYFELEPAPGLVTIAHLGLLDRFQGLGIGGHALTAAIRRGFELAPRVLVSTNTLDSPHALANYTARGMRIVRSVVERRLAATPSRPK